MARRSVEQIARTKATEPPHPTTGRAQPSLRPAPDNWSHTTIATPRTRQLVTHTRRCAAGPYRWSMGDLAHAPPQGLTCASKGAGHHPSGLSSPSPCSKRSPLRLNRAIFGNFHRSGLRFGTNPEHCTAPTHRRAPQVGTLTRQCAAGPYRWSMGDLAHAPPQGLTCASKGAGHHPSGYHSTARTVERATAPDPFPSGKTAGPMNISPAFLYPHAVVSRRPVAIHKRTDTQAGPQVPRNRAADGTRP